MNPTAANSTPALMLGRALLLALLMLLGPASARAAMGTLVDDPSNRLHTVPHDPAMQQAVLDSGLGSMVVNHAGWRETLTSYSRVMLYEITGRARVGRQAPEYTILSMTYNPRLWHDAQIFPLEHPDLLTMLGAEGKWVSARFVVENPNMPALLEAIRTLQPLRRELERVTKLLNAVEQARALGTEMRVLSMYEHEGIASADVLELYDNPDLWRETYKKRKELADQVDAERPANRAAEQLLSRIDKLSKLGTMLLIVPDDEGAETRWVRPALVTGTTPLMLAGREFDTAMERAFLADDTAAVTTAAGAFLERVESSRYYTSENYRKLQNFYVTRNPWTSAAWIYLVGAGLFGLYFFFRNNAYYRGAVALLVVGFLMHTSAVVIRGYLKGHVPVSNIYESVTFTSWGIMLFALGFEAWSRRGMVGLGSCIVGFLFLVGAGLMPLHETRIHPLRAVLNSYWLNIHVTMMLLSYAAFALSAFFAGLYVLRALLRRDALVGTTPIINQIQTEEFAYRLVQLGWPILTFGIALGAVWADTAWGRFWGWDPKETWAFITWVGYTVYLHTRMVMGWRGTSSAVACLVGFALVLITWLGVSYIPIFSGGLHSYASPNTF